MINEAIAVLSQGKDLSALAMAQSMEEIMSGKACVKDIVSFLKLLSKKGESIDEITAAVSVMRRYATKIEAKRGIVLDTCGTGGDVKGTFNISTAVAFVACGCGITVAKHGNRSVSSHCGSADVLEALGVNIRLSKDKLENCLNEVGIAFLFAPELHPAMKFAMPARKEIGKKTMFNILGPLSNPAGATHQLVGVYDDKWLHTVATVLAKLGSVRAMVVHGEDGLDEITTTASTKVCESVGQEIKSYSIDPEEFGFKKSSPDDLRGGDAAQNATILLDILKGSKGPHRDIVLLNAAAALYVTDKVKSIRDGIVTSEKCIDSGEALKKLELLKEYSKE
jgi:anthranilate phosphoribosyltransferase